jgi:hypothetical protein
MRHMALMGQLLPRDIGAAIGPREHYIFPVKEN